MINIYYPQSTDVEPPSVFGKMPNKKKQPKEYWICKCKKIEVLGYEIGKFCKKCFKRIIWK